MLLHVPVDGLLPVRPIYACPGTIAALALHGRCLCMCAACTCVCIATGARSHTLHYMRCFGKARCFYVHHNRSPHMECDRFAALCTSSSFGVHTPALRCVPPCRLPAGTASARRTNLMLGGT